MIIVSGSYDVFGLIELKAERKTKTFVERVSLKIDMDNIYIGNKLYLYVGTCFENPVNCSRFCA